MIHAFAWMLLIKGLIRQSRKLLAVGTISKAGGIFTVQTPVCRIRYCFHPEKTPGENIHNKATKEAFHRSRGLHGLRILVTVEPNSDKNA